MLDGCLILPQSRGMPEPLYHITDRTSRSRRSFLFSTVSLAAAARFSSWASGPVTAVPTFVAYPFQLGVASGDPTPTGVVLWTRLAPVPLEGGGMSPEPVQVSWQIAEDEAMTRVVQSGNVIASSDWAHSVHVEVEGLKPDRWYWYQFKAGKEISPKGRTRTMPPADSLPARLRFAMASCQHYETGFYTAYEHMGREDLDLVVHLGDYIYEMKAMDGRCRKHNSAEIITLEDYRNRYAQYKSDADLQRMHAQAPWLVTWDDHEVDNDYAGANSEEAGVSPETLLRRRAAAYKAYYEHLPLRRSSLPNGPDMKIYRTASFGRLAQFFVLDTRQYRTDQPCGGGNVPPCGGEMNANATLMGAEQRDWLFNGMNTSQAAWNVLAQQIMMARVDRLPGEKFGVSMDQWPGYEMDHRAVLRHFHEHKISNPIVLTGDIHTNWANELIADFDQLDSAVVGTEFVGSSISSSGNGPQFPKYLDDVLHDNPFVKFHNGERGYVSCEVTPKQWLAHYRTVPYVDRHGAPLNTRASFLVESGRAGLNRV